MDAPLYPAQLLLKHLDLFTQNPLPGPVLDLACGDGHNGIFLAQQGIPIICCDRSAEALAKARELAQEKGLSLQFWQVDLEEKGVNPLPEEAYGGILVFRYLHRPLIPCIKKALRSGGLLIYETFTMDQPRFGKPHNPDFLLQPGELKGWFADWEIFFYFEGLKEDPPRSMAQIVCRKV
jgi:tellurite methyltransferase